MVIQLRVLHGELRHMDGTTAGTVITIRQQRFVIGSGPDCHMRCRSEWISAAHCAIECTEDQVRVHDMGRGSGTYVNGRQAQGAQLLSNGDRLQIGKLQFEVLARPISFESHSEAAAATVGKQPDELANYVCGLLSEADEEDRHHRRCDPATRIFPAPKPAPPKEPMRGMVSRRAILLERLRTPAPPRKLPPPPPIRSVNSAQGAQLAMNEILLAMRIWRRQRLINLNNLNQ